MSAEIKDLQDPKDVHRLTGRASEVHFRAQHASRKTPGEASALMDRADFLAAVAAECDVIVIPREELPEVTEDSGCLTVGAGALTVGAATTVADADAAIREWVAIREYRMTHPPVDEAQVEALAEDMCAAGHVAISDGAIEARYAAARRLVALGWTKAVRP